MTLGAFLDLLDAVRPRGTGRWSARCPAHADRSPSLSIAGGDRGLLLHCWAGCTIEEICTALGLQVADLFIDGRPDPEHQRHRTRARQAQEQQRLQEGLVIDSMREAERYIHSRRGINISAWTDEQLDAELGALADAYSIMGGRDSHA